jgi:Flp pilus assembly protein TadG
MKMINARRAGQSMTEFALVFPLLALFLFAIIQYGFIFSAYMTLRHAANVTARTISLSGGATNNAATVARNAVTPMLDSSKLGTVVVNQTTVSTANDAYSVRLSYNLPLIISFVVPGSNGGTLVLNAQAIYRKGG